MLILNSFWGAIIFTGRGPSVCGGTIIFTQGGDSPHKPTAGLVLAWPDHEFWDTLLASVGTPQPRVTYISRTSQQGHTSVP